jgi:magnesium chelatase family protein
MYAEIQTSALQGADALPVRVECHATQGLPTVQITGLPDGTVRDAIPRIISAARFCGMPIRLTRRVVVNLLPADVPKRGSSFDLPMALGMLAALGDIDPKVLKGVSAFGELGLDGRIQPVRGILALASSTQSQVLMVPFENRDEALEIRGKNVLAPRTLEEAVRFLALSNPPFHLEPSCQPPSPTALIADVDLSEVKGQPLAKRALEIAAAGGHNLLMVGAPGSGKSMLARAMTGILPPMLAHERMEASRIHSIAGLLPRGASLLHVRPFRAPHATVSEAGLIGSARFPHLGELSLAHRGVLFLDEFPEFRRSVLEQLRQPLEDGEFSLVRAGLRLRLPARIVLLAAMNPCPCGFLGNKKPKCRCRESEILKYRARISGPILDRMDLQVTLKSLVSKQWMQASGGESSARVRARVAQARKRQEARGQCNAQLRGEALRGLTLHSEDSRELLRRAMDGFGLTARGADRSLRVARTIADLAGSVDVLVPHLAEAMHLRMGQKKRAPEGTL